jgi:hypothetical protein
MILLFLIECNSSLLYDQLEGAKPHLDLFSRV